MCRLHFGIVRKFCPCSPKSHPVYRLGGTKNQCNVCFPRYRGNVTALACSLSVLTFPKSCQHCALFLCTLRCDEVRCCLGQLGVSFLLSGRSRQLAILAFTLFAQTTNDKAFLYQHNRVSFRLHPRRTPRGDFDHRRPCRASLASNPSSTGIRKTDTVHQQSEAGCLCAYKPRCYQRLFSGSGR